ncbi:hypothetical protein EON64_06840 [archaeon]|nr:MAG: hypothetical protein EON64_06840 [archaeon]
MEPVVKRLEDDLKIKVRRVNINRRADFVMLYEAVGGMSTSTIPFFYNRRTAQAISGPSPYDNLRRLAMGSTLHSFVEQPESAFSKSEYDPRRQRGTGISDYLFQKVFAGSVRSMGRPGNKVQAEKTRR